MRRSAVKPSIHFDKRIKAVVIGERPLRKDVMEQAIACASAKDHAFELARWYHELAKLCIQAAEQNLHLTEESELEDVERAMALNDLVRIRMGTVQSVERVFRAEFSRLYIEHQVEHILSLDPGPEPQPNI